MTSSNSRVAFAWPQGKRAAVSLSFDDARPTQIDVGVPILDRFGFKATFYVNLPALDQRLDAWKRAADQGHEIANHTVHHACSGNFPFARNKPLERYTLDQMEAELLEANQHIRQAVGVMPRSFAYPCGQKFVGRGEKLQSYVPLVARHFLTGRGFRDEWHNDPLECDAAQLFGVDSDRTKFDGLKFWLDRVIEQGGWLVFASHDVHPQGHQAMHPDTLEAICRYCADETKGVWIDNVGVIGAYVRECRGY